MRFRGLFHLGFFALLLGPMGQTVVMADEPPYAWVSTWSLQDRAMALALDDSGNVYFASVSNQIQKYGPAGNWMMTWGSDGTGDGQFLFVADLALDASGHVYVVDSGNNRIQKFDRNGHFLGKWGSAGTGPGEFTSPQHVATDASSNVYVADGHGGIQKFDSNGVFLLSWAADGDLATGPEGHVYVAGDPIRVYDANGSALFSFGSGSRVTTDANGNVYAISGGGLFAKFGAQGDLLTSAPASDQAGCGQPGWFAVLEDIGVGPTGVVDLLDYYCELVQTFAQRAVSIEDISWGSAKQLWR